MAVDISKFIDNSLKAVFEAKPYDVSKDRAKLIKRFQGALTQYKAGNAKAPNKLWKLKNGVVEFSASVNGYGLTINGADTNYMPEEQFAGFIAGLIEMTGEGAFDSHLSVGDGAKASSTKSGGGSKPASTRTYSEESLLNIRVGGFRRGAAPQAWDDIRKLLIDEGVSAEMADKAIAKKQAVEKAA